VALAWQRRLHRVRRVKITALGSAGTAASLFASLLLPGLAGPLTTSITRDLLPCVLNLLFYSLCGLFVTGANAGLEARLLQLDRLLVAPPLIWCAGSFFGPWLLGSLELAYLSYYIAVPGAAANAPTRGPGKGSRSLLDRGFARRIRILRQAGLRTDAAAARARGKVGLIARFRQAVRLQSLDSSKRQRPGEHLSQRPRGDCRGVRVGPAAHRPALGGPLFLVIGVGIALGAVAGRYHYTADAILGLLTAAAAWLAGIGLVGLGR
jgi:hypothetical protein